LEDEFLMGLAVSVGYFADIIANDEEAAKGIRDEMARLNDFLASSGLAAHREPEACEAVSYDMYGYSGLHYLRRIAAHLDLTGVLPPPGGTDSSKDKVMEEYYRLASQGQPGLFGRLFRRTPKSRTYDHLLLHGDAEGYYLPQDFASVLFPPDKLKIPGGMIGSSVRLKEECERLATALQLPLELDPEAEEVWQACQSQGQGNVNWQRYGIESFVCLRLYAASQRSIELGAAIVFC
jgi:hypothetical protein